MDGPARLVRDWLLAFAREDGRFAAARSWREYAVRYRVISALLRSDFAQSTVRPTPIGDLHGQFRP
jgi:hypothetical protein